MEGGRPTDYKEEYCKILEDLGRKGRHVHEMAAYLGVAKNTLYEWCKIYPMFKDSLSRARTFSCAWWEDKARSHLTNPDFNYKIWEFNLRSKYGMGDKDRLINIKSISDATTHTERGLEVIKALCTGEITADEANKIADVISKLAKVEEVDELKAELEKYRENNGLTA